jgi:hypothetical protein
MIIGTTGGNIGNPEVCAEGCTMGGTNVGITGGGYIGHIMGGVCCARKISIGGRTTVGAGPPGSGCCCPKIRTTGGTVIFVIATSPSVTRTGGTALCAGNYGLYTRSDCRARPQVESLFFKRFVA